MENEICKDFGGSPLCDCKQGYHMKDKRCVSKGITFIFMKKKCQTKYPLHHSYILV